ncbi:MAG TPA: MEDS domain-containing protein, partial [Longimicrobiaceae bacterium]|nr:MEDS domain-containing protein [Longimicrobiaceae bacterium]
MIVAASPHFTENPMTRPAEAAPTAAGWEHRPTGILAIGPVAWGTHICHFYEAREDLLEITIPFFRAGLELNEFCLWISSESDPDVTRQDLRNAFPDADDRLRRGDIEIIHWKDWYVVGGEFDADRVIAGWQRMLDGALLRGYEGMRVHANEAWLTRSTWSAFAEYEKALDRALLNKRMIVLCTYPLEGSTGSEVFDVARTHKLALARRDGAWEVLETVALVAAKAEVQRQNEALEARVRQRTRELEKATAALRESEGKLEEAQRIAHVGYWENDLDGDRLAWSNETYRILG